MYITNLQMLSIFLNFDWKSCKNLILSEKWKDYINLCYWFFFWIWNVLKDLFLYLLREICFGKKNSYNFIFLVMKVTAFVTLWQIQYKKFFFCRYVPIFASVYFIGKQTIL